MTHKDTLFTAAEAIVAKSFSNGSWEPRTEQQKKEANDKLAAMGIKLESLSEFRKRVAEEKRTARIAAAAKYFNK